MRRRRPLKCLPRSHEINHGIKHAIDPAPEGSQRGDADSTMGKASGATICTGLPTGRPESLRIRSARASTADGVMGKRPRAYTATAKRASYS